MENEEIKELPEGIKMTPRTFADYILKHMTAEEALLRLLEGPLITYHKLRFPEGEQEVHPLMIATMAAMEMGWDFMIEKQDDSDEVRGFSIGSKEYFDDLLRKKVTSKEMFNALFEYIRDCDPVEYDEERASWLKGVIGNFVKKYYE